MAKPESARERREKAEKFQSFNRPKIKVARTSADGTVYIDYKDTESLRKMISGNGKILSRKRTSAYGDGAADDRRRHQAFAVHGVAALRDDCPVRAGCLADKHCLRFGAPDVHPGLFRLI